MGFGFTDLSSFSNSEHRFQKGSVPEFLELQILNAALPMNCSEPQLLQVANFFTGKYSAWYPYCRKKPWILDKIVVLIILVRQFIFFNLCFVCYQICFKQFSSSGITRFTKD